MSQKHLETNNKLTEGIISSEIGEKNYTMKIYGYEGKANLVGKNVKFARRDLGLSQNELAIRLQLENVVLTQKCISRIENGDRFVADYELLALSRALKRTLNQLLGIDER